MPVLEYAVNEGVFRQETDHVLEGDGQGEEPTGWLCRLGGWWLRSGLEVCGKQLGQVGGSKLAGRQRGQGSLDENDSVVERMQVAETSINHCNGGEGKMGLTLSPRPPQSTGIWTQCLS